MNIFARIGILLGLSLLGAACTTTQVDLAATFPTPLVEPLPVVIGVQYDEAFRNYKLEEELPGQGKVIINAGTMNVALFESLLPGLFAGVESVETNVPAGSQKGVLVPSLQELQFTLPSQTRNGWYEIWLKYRLQLFGNDGKLIAEWPIQGYGKSPEPGFPGTLMKTTSGGLNDAAVVAYRDIAARLTMGLRDVPELADWIREATKS